MAKDFDKNQEELKEKYLDIKKEMDYLSQKRLSDNIEDAKNQITIYNKHKTPMSDKVARFFQKQREKAIYSERIIEQYRKESISVPNSLLKPFEYKQWEIVGDIMHFRETQSIGEPRRAFREFINRFGQNFGGIVGVILIIALILGALIVPFFTLDPTRPDGEAQYLDVFTRDVHGNMHILGTDNIGRDIFAVLFHGLRFSLALAFCVTVIEIVVGLIVGILMGQFEWFDKVMTFIIKVVSIVPTILILILATIAFNPSFIVMVIALALFSWTGLANQVRAQVKRAKNYEWVYASKVLGTSTARISLSFVPVILPILITNLIFSIPGTIFAEVSLAFLGQSIPGAPTLGNLLDSASNIFTIHVRYLIIPATILIILTVSIQLIGAAIQDSLRRQR